MSSITVSAIDQLNASFEVPGDKSISHRAAIMAGLSNGECRIQNFLPSEDCLCTLNAMASLGVFYEVLESMEGFGPTSLLIHGQHMKLKPPKSEVDCGNSGTGMRLLAGMLSAQPFESVLTGDASLCSRPMKRIITPLEQMGAHIASEGTLDGCAPLRLGFQSKSKKHELTSITYEMPVASAQVKSAILLAGLFTVGKTTVIQPKVTRDHTERMFFQFHLLTEVKDNHISIYGGQIPEATDLYIPGDISSAAFWIVAAAAIPGSHLSIRQVGLNPTRTAILDVLMRMGAEIQIETTSRPHEEPCGNIVVKGGPLKGTEVLPEEIPNLIDEIPVLAVAGALAQGKTTIRNAQELRVKESDRIATVVSNLKVMGVDVEEFEDGMEITGGNPLSGAEMNSFGDHRIAMAFLIAGLFAEGETIMHGTDCINTSYPGFSDHLAMITQSDS